MTLNRKERRAQEKKQSKTSIPAIKNIPASDHSENAESFKKQGLALRAQGKDAEAVAPLKKALQLDNSLADVHFALAMLSRSKPELKIDMKDINRGLSGAKLIDSYKAIMVILRQKRQYKEAVICQEELCRLSPDDAYTLMDLGLILNIAGQYERAAVEMSKAFNMAPGDKVLKGIYSSAMNNPPFSVFYPEVKQAILACFEDNYDVNLRHFWFPWINLMVKDPAFATLSEARITDDVAFKIWADSLNEETGKFLSEPYFTGGLRLLIIANRHIEAILTKLRRYICLEFNTLVSNGRIKLFEYFIYALAEHCFFNEYVYAEEDDEAQTIKSLLETTDKIQIGLIACYQPLYKVMRDKADLFQDMAKKDAIFARLIKTQFDDLEKEEQLKNRLPRHGKLANEVSMAVQNQYEENPYPRWTTICTTPLPQDEQLFDKTKNLPFKILIAGCGTGRQAISTAIRHPNSKITAIDLSRSSLAYGMRKAQECGVDDRIDFVHADILSMETWPEDFDIIECSGVLHHMQDPQAGWKILTGKLKLNGLFKIGLYSEIARQPIVQARELIRDKGYASTPAGIKACRQAIFALPPHNPISDFVTMSGDFYALSPVRDLIFHVQEHLMSLPQIKRMMDDLGLECVKFILSSAETLYNYDKSFPSDIQRKSFENWEKFEKKYPMTFAGMYQFWCQKTKQI